MFFKNRSSRKKKTKQTNNTSKTDDRSYDRNKEAFKVGSSIAKLITSSWNSQEKPGKVYIFNRRVHHGGIGSLLGLSNLLKKSQPIPTGILSGLGEGLAKDDYADRDEWFKFEKKHDDTLVPETTTTTTSSTDTEISYTDFSHDNTKTRHDDNKTSAIEGTKESSSKNQDEEKQ
jgi:hypothetical protein